MVFLKAKLRWCSHFRIKVCGGLFVEIIPGTEAYQHSKKNFLHQGCDSAL